MKDDSKTLDFKPSDAINFLTQLLTNKDLPAVKYLPDIFDVTFEEKEIRCRFRLSSHNKERAVQIAQQINLLMAKEIKLVKLLPKFELMPRDELVGDVYFKRYRIGFKEADWIEPIYKHLDSLRKQQEHAALTTVAIQVGLGQKDQGSLISRLPQSIAAKITAGTRETNFLTQKQAEVAASGVMTSVANTLSQRLLISRYTLTELSSQPRQLIQLTEEDEKGFAKAGFQMW